VEEDGGAGASVMARQAGLAGGAEADDAPDGRCGARGGDDSRRPGVGWSARAAVFLSQQRHSHSWRYERVRTEGSPTGAVCSLAGRQRPPL
jgi:hypothetical protein